MLTKENIVPSDLHYALSDLAELTNQVRNILTDMDYVRQDGTRIHELDAVAAFVRIAEARIEQLADACLRFDSMRFDNPKSAPGAEA